LKFEREASYYLEIIKENNAPKIYSYLSSRLASSSPLLLLTSALFDLEEIVFIDIETLGLRGVVPLFLIGVAAIKNGNIIVNQILARDLNEEKAALHFLSEYLKDKKAICSFNGKSFDIPFINTRLKTHNIKYEVSHPHYDIRYFAARAFKNSIENCKLTTLESKLFQTQREEDIPSSEVPEFYKSFVRNNNIGTIVPVINHNKQDLISTVNIFIKLHEIWS
jgi:uncharacterized protein YprB with RNaseH-like and TPR domain